MSDKIINKDLVKNFLINLQSNIIETIEMVDGSNFLNDSWQRKEGGGGTTCIMEHGDIFERAGVGFSHVIGSQLPKSATVAHPEVANRRWEAMGLSLVFHPFNPFIPTVHMNVRFFIASKNGEKDIWWFGGGMDLTPFYPFLEDVIHFHQTLKNTIQPFGENLYKEFKQNCDKYFFLNHRDEPRGVGCVFYDDFNKNDFQYCLNLTKSIGQNFLHAYLPIVQKRKDKKFEEHHKKFQHFRRGRYVEFNLLQDRGTLFGIQSKGRVESILMSMHPMVRWGYDFKPIKGSEEEKLYTDFLINRDWV